MCAVFFIVVVVVIVVVIENSPSSRRVQSITEKSNAYLIRNDSRLFSITSTASLITITITISIYHPNTAKKPPRPKFNTPYQSLEPTVTVLKDQIHY